MSNDELNSLLNSVKIKLKKPNYSSSNTEQLTSNIQEFEFELFKYFLEKNIDTIFILYTNAIFIPQSYMGLCISFSNPLSLKIFEDKWGKYISDTSCIIKRVKNDRITGEYTAITLTLYGNSLYNFGALLEDELQTELINKTMK